MPDSLNPLPFAFAKRHHVLFAGIENNAAKILFCKQPDLAVLNELQRFFSVPLSFEQVDEETFGKRLVKNYQTDSNTAMQMAEDLGESLDLFHLMQELPKPEDLLERKTMHPLCVY